MKNKYVKLAQISEKKFRQILKYFASDLSVSEIAKLCNLNRVTINRIIQKIRIRLYELSLKENPLLQGIIEADESSFGAKRVRGRRGRGAKGKIKVFGLLKREGKVYTEVVNDVSAKTLQGIIRGKIKLKSEIHTDGWKAYDGLVDLGYEKHYRVIHNNNEFANKTSHINGLESFWGYAKNRMIKFNGIKSQYFDLHLKETEFRFNYRKDNFYKLLLTEFRLNPL